MSGKTEGGGKYGGNGLIKVGAAVHDRGVLAAHLNNQLLDIPPAAEIAVDPETHELTASGEGSAALAGSEAVRRYLRAIYS